MSDPIRVSALFRYPVKGLSPEELPAVDLETGAYFPGDRLFAVENGPSGFDPAAPVHQPKIKFLMLMRNERLAHLRTRYDDATAELVIEHDGKAPIRARVDTAEGRAAIESFFAGYMRYELRGEPKFLAAPDGFRFTDSRAGFVSLINLASVRAIEEMVGTPVDPLRFRGNIHVEGLKPWAEFDLVDEVLVTEAGVKLKVEKRIDRCAATNVDPMTGQRDLDIPKTLLRRLGHVDCGVYLSIRDGGTLRPGDVLRLP